MFAFAEKDRIQWSQSFSEVLILYLWVLAAMLKTCLEEKTLHQEFEERKGTVR
jgi:hypothetical protein